MATVADNWREVRLRVDQACERAGRSPHDVTVVAVAKTHPASAIREAVAAGALHIGENYAQELADKRAELGDLAVQWHFIGRLQRNKAKLVAGHVVLVHAVEGPELAQELAKRAGGQVQAVLLAVNAAGELTKGGVSAEQAPAVAAAIAQVAGIRLDGLMTMPPPDADPVAPFRALRDLRQRIQDHLGRELPVLSMGMSGDFEAAIACGSTHVRIGTAIFGVRPSPG